MNLIKERFKKCKDMEYYCGIKEQILYLKEFIVSNGHVFGNILQGMINQVQNVLPNINYSVFF